MVILMGSPYPIVSMYGIFSYIYLKNQPNVGIYTIHGSYAYNSALFWLVSYVHFPLVTSCRSASSNCRIKSWQSERKLRKTQGEKRESLHVPHSNDFISNQLDKEKDDLFYELFVKVHEQTSLILALFE